MIQSVILLAQAAQEGSSGASDLQVALVGALAAVLGAAVGGVVTRVVALRAEDKRQTFARETEDQRRNDEAAKEAALARGAARL
jgi:hypothetical protein